MTESTQNQQPPPSIPLEHPLYHLTEAQATRLVHKCDHLGEAGRAFNIVYAIALLQLDHLYQMKEAGDRGKDDERVNIALQDLLYLMAGYLPEL